MTNDKYKLVCGMEIHTELKTDSKMFCGCKNDPFGAKQPNIYTCPVCLGLPGGLPVANKKAVEWTIKIGLALGCRINLFSKFDRKHYFYPDLPKGYQISQYDQPLCENGVVKTEFGDVRIRRVHLEEDTGKLLHQEVDGKKVSLIDFNRSSVPLVEIVTEADIHSPEQAREYAKTIHQLVRDLNVSDADMEKGSMRLEANISVTTKDASIDGELPPYKVEVKNLNSFRYVERAIKYEMERQAEILDKGEIPKQETRGWNDPKSETFAQRSKESAEDYRYFPDPDLPPMHFSEKYVEAIRSSLPERIDEKIKRWVSDFAIKQSDAAILLQDRDQAFKLEQIFASNPKVPAAKLASLLVNKKITFGDDLLTQAQALSKVDEVADEELETAIKSVIEEQPKAVNDYKSGKIQVIGFLIGMVNKKIGKKVDVNRIKSLLEKELK